MILPMSERLKNRMAVARLVSLQDAIEGSLRTGNVLPTETTIVLGQLSQSDDIETQMHMVMEWLDQTKDGYREQLRLAARDSLSCFAEFLNMEEAPVLHHDFLCEKLEAVARREIMRILISMPPGHAKSTYASHLFPAWYMGRFPNHRYIQAGHTQDFVDEELGKKVRGIIDSEDYREVFPEIRLSQTSKAASRFALGGKFKGKYLGRGVGGGISGFRGNIAAVDDPFASREDVESPAIRKKVFDWFMADLTTRLLPRSPLFVVATRWHSDDLCGRLEKMTKDGVGMPFEIINLPAIADSDNDPLGRSPGSPLWPQFYDESHLMNLKATLPSRDWNSLYMGQPMDIEGGAFKSDWVKRYETIPNNEISDSGRIVRQFIRRCVVSVDCANKTGERNDYTVCEVWIEDMSHRHYLVDVVRKRFEFNEMVTAIEDTVDTWNHRLLGIRVGAILVEDKGSGTQYIQTRKGKAPAPVIAIEVGQDSKAFRFDGTLPMWEAGEVLLPNTAIWLPDFEAELVGFPFANHDDQVDAAAQYLNWARARPGGGNKKMIGIGHDNASTSSNTGGGRMTFGRGKARMGDFKGASEYTPGARIGG